jgi:hypothetical protein
MRYLALCVLVFLFSCKTKKDIVETGAEDVIISLQKEGCYGTCPVYKFEIFKGGYCEFNGQQHTYKQGKHSLQLSDKKYKEVLSSFKKADLFKYEDFYESNIPDLPQITISYTEKNKTKTIVGKRESPEAIHKLQVILEQIAESKDGWTIIDGTVQEVKPKLDKTQIVLELKNGAQLSRWFNKAKDDYGIRILKKLDDSFDSWLVSYNMKKFGPNEILELLKKDENVSSASFKRLNP